MNKYIFILAAGVVFAAQAGMTTRYEDEKGHLMPVQTRQKAKALQKPTMNLQAPAEDLTFKAEEFVYEEPKYASQTEKEFAKAQQMRQLTTNDQQQFLNELGAQILALTHGFNLKIAECNAGLPRVPGETIATYFNSKYVGRPELQQEARERGSSNGAAGRANMYCSVKFNGTAAQKQAALNIIHNFAQEKAGAYHHECFVAGGGREPQNYLLRYQNPNNNNTYCYVYTSQSLTNIVPNVMPKALDTAAEVLEKPVSAIKSFFGRNGNGK